MYAIGMVIKLLKLPMHTVFILVSLLALIVYYISCLVRKNKELHEILTGFVTVIWLFGLLSLLKHFPFYNIVLIIASLISLVLFFMIDKKKNLTTANNILLFVTIFITVVLNFVPAHQTYYITNIKFSYEIETDYRSWDRYSWFLYVAGEEKEALSANVNAQKALEVSLANPDTHGNENEYLPILKDHELAIKNRNWIKYP